MQFSLGLVQASRPVWRIEEWRRGNQGPQAGMIRGQLKAVGPDSEALPPRAPSGGLKAGRAETMGGDDFHIMVPVGEVGPPRERYGGGCTDL